jgi:hypothetical protein
MVSLGFPPTQCNLRSRILSRFRPLVAETFARLPPAFCPSSARLPQPRRGALARHCQASSAARSPPLPAGPPPCTVTVRFGSPDLIRTGGTRGPRNRRRLSREGGQPLCARHSGGRTRAPDRGRREAARAMHEQACRDGPPRDCQRRRPFQRERGNDDSRLSGRSEDAQRRCAALPRRRRRHPPGRRSSLTRRLRSHPAHPTRACARVRPSQRSRI